MASSMLPPARPFRLNVHVLPAEASNNLHIEPTHRFLQVTPRTKTLLQFCDDISVRHRRQYGQPLNIKKCQVASGSDLDLEYQLSDVFEDHDVIRVIEAPVRGAFFREDSLFPDSSLRPKNAHGRESKRARSRSSSVRSQSWDFRRDEDAPNKRQRLLDPNHPVRSLERDLEDDDLMLVNGDHSLMEVENSQQFGTTAEDQEHVNGIPDVRYSIDYGHSIGPHSSPPRLRKWQEIEQSQADTMQSTPQNYPHELPQSSLDSPFNLFTAANVSPQLPMTRIARSGSETSSHHQDDISVNSTTGQQRRSGSQRYSIPNHANTNVAGRRNSTLAVATTPLEPVIPDTPDRGNNFKRHESVRRSSMSLGRNSSERRARVDVYDDIETDTEVLSHFNRGKASSSARKIREDRAREEAEEKQRRLAMEESTKRQREVEGEAKAAHREQQAAAAEARRRNEELLAEQERRAQAEAKRIRLEQQRQEEGRQEAKKKREADRERQAERDIQAEEEREADREFQAEKAREAGREAEKERHAEKERQAAKKRKAEQQVEDHRARDLAKEKKRMERAAHTAQKDAKKVANAAQGANKERAMTASTPDLELSKGSSELSTNSTNNVAQVGLSGFPPCPNRGIWTDELDNILIEAREKNQSFDDIWQQRFSTMAGAGVLQRRYRTIIQFRQKHLEQSRRQTHPTSTQTQTPATPLASTSTIRRESSTAPIPSNGKMVPSLTIAVSSPAVATSSPHPTSDRSINFQVPPSSKARRSVSFANESIPASGQRPTGLESKKETHVPPPKPKFSSTPIPPPKSIFSSTSESSSLNQAKLRSRRLSITSAKTTDKAATTVSKTPNKLIAKPAIKTPLKTYSHKKQAKLLPDANVSSKKKASVDSRNKDRGEEARGVSPHKLASTDKDSDDVSSAEPDGEDLENSSRKVQVRAGKKTTTKVGRTSPVERNKEIVIPQSQSRSSSGEQSPIRDSRSPVAFMSKQASPTISDTNSHDRENSHEIRASDASSSSPLLQDDKLSEMEIDERSTKSEADHLCLVEVDEASTNGQRSFINPTPEQEMEDQIQSQIRRDSSQRDSKSFSSQNISPKPQHTRLTSHPSSTMFPSLIAMSQLQREKLRSSDTDDESKRESAKQSEEPEDGSEEESEEESDESNSDSNDDSNQGNAARNAGTDLGRKAGKKKGISFGSISKMVSKKR